MAHKLAINGFGRIGRLTLRSILERNLTAFEVVAVNDLTDAATLAHLFKYDSVHGQYPGHVSADGDHLLIDDFKIPVLSERDPSNLPWTSLGCDVVIESTGFFRDRASATKHLRAGANKVVISAPAKDTVDATIVLGVNDHVLTGQEEIISNASCTTNCIAPMIKVVDEAFGIQSGLMTTVHAYTSDQRIQDAPHKDLRRARAGAYSIVPTTTGAAKAVGLVLPHMKGKLDGMALRVPIPNGSLTDLTVQVSATPSKEDVNSAFRTAANGPLSGILEYASDPIVSIDIVHNAHSVIFDSLATMVQGNSVKILGWYDNEWGYANRAVDVAALLVSKAS
ncbi:MAG: type I glyceraldehyde-3-phosphate dehydrogenase [Bacteroidetes bacterium]|nr:type I glyceraldehyde-3-phosphate dehydrogenase [Bacteroidota bacterium]MCY4233089.1 type I glyceraldehyde-3-phosphate dehydrogenase [Bacteroidota bacterium]